MRKTTVDAFDILVGVTFVAGSDGGNIGSVTIVVVLVMMVAFCGLPDTAGQAGCKTMITPVCRAQKLPKVDVFPTCARWTAEYNQMKLN